MSVDCSHWLTTWLSNCRHFDGIGTHTSSRPSIIWFCIYKKKINWLSIFFHILINWFLFFPFQFLFDHFFFHSPLSSPNLLSLLVFGYDLCFLSFLLYFTYPLSVPPLLLLIFASLFLFVTSSSFSLRIALTPCLYCWSTSLHVWVWSKATIKSTELPIQSWWGLNFQYRVDTYFNLRF